MKSIWIITAVGLATLSACSTGQSVRIDCGATDVIVSEDQLNAMRSNAGEADVATSICLVANEVDSSSYTKPQSLNVTMPSGNQYDVKAQTSQQ